jgi:hypothetical protein
VSNALQPAALASNIAASLILGASYGFFERLTRAWKWWKFIPWPAAGALCFWTLLLLAQQRFLILGLIAAVMAILFLVASRSRTFSEEVENREFVILHIARDNCIKLLNKGLFTYLISSQLTPDYIRQLDAIGQTERRKLLERLNELCVILRTAIVDGLVEGRVLNRQSDGSGVHVAFFLPTERKGFKIDEIKRVCRSCQRKADIIQELIRSIGARSFIKLYGTSNTQSLSSLHQGLLPRNSSLAGDCFDKRIPLVHGMRAVGGFKKGQWEGSRFFDVEAVNALQGGDNSRPLDLGAFSRQFAPYPAKVTVALPIFEQDHHDRIVGVICLYFCQRGIFFQTERTADLILQLCYPISVAVVNELKKQLV